MRTKSLTFDAGLDGLRAPSSNHYEHVAYIQPLTIRDASPISFSRSGRELK